MGPVEYPVRAAQVWVAAHSHPKSLSKDEASEQKHLEQSWGKLNDAQQRNCNSQREITESCNMTLLAGSSKLGPHVLLVLHTIGSWIHMESFPSFSTSCSSLYLEKTARVEQHSDCELCAVRGHKWACLQA